MIGIMNFPKTSDKGHGVNAQMWIRLDNTYVAHDSIDIKNTVSQKESVIISNAMNIASGGVSYATENGWKTLMKKWEQRKHERRGNNYLGQCIVRYYCCASKDCPVKYKVQRLQGEIVIYQIHKHKHEVPKRGGRGIPEGGKLFVKENMHGSRSINHITSKIMDFPPDQRKYYVGSKSSKEEVRESIRGYIRTAKRNIAKMGGSDSLLSEENVGGTLEELKAFLKCHEKSQDEFVMSSDILAGRESHTIQEATMRERITILSHDVGQNEDGRWTYIVIAHLDTMKIVDRSINLMRHRDRQGVQLEINGTASIFDGNDRILLVIGTSDANRKFHAIVYVIVNTENGEVCDEALRVVCALYVSRGGQVMRVLRDGGKALAWAIKNNLLAEASCLSHMARGTYSRDGKHGSGTKAALPVYLKKKGCPQWEIDMMVVFLLVFCHLPMVEEYRNARSLLMMYVVGEDYTLARDEKVKNHVFKEYFPPNPHFGCIHQEGEVWSTNGLEKSWDHLKKEIKDIQTRMGHTVIQSVIRFFSQKGGETVKNGKVVEFAEKPRDNIEDWMKIEKYSEELPKHYGEAFYFCNSCRTCINPQILFHTMESVDEYRRTYGDRIMVLIPASHYLENCYVDCLLRYISAGKDGQGEGNGAGTDHVSSKEMKRYEKHPILRKAIEIQLCKDVQEDSINILKTDLNVVNYLLRRAQRNEHVRRTRFVGQTIKRIDDLDELGGGEDTQQQKLLGDIQFIEPDATHFERKKRVSSPRKKKVKTIDDEKSQSALGQQHKASLQRQLGLGYFRKVYIDFGLKKVKCTCEEYRRNGICMESRLYGVLFFKTLPPDYCISTYTRGWMKIRDELQKSLYMRTTWSNKRCDILHEASSCTKGKCGCVTRSEQREKNVNYDSAGVVMKVVVPQQEALESTSKTSNMDC